MCIYIIFLIFLFFVIDDILLITILSLSIFQYIT